MSRIGKTSSREVFEIREQNKVINNGVCETVGGTVASKIDL